MKNIITTLLITLVYTIGFSQDIKYNDLIAYLYPVEKEKPYPDHSQNLWYSIQGTYNRPVKQEKLKDMNLLSEIDPGYPSNWLHKYISTEIRVNSKGKSVKALGLDDKLSSDQIKILNSVDIGAEIFITARYASMNSANDNIEIRTMNFSLTVIPEKEAEFPGNYQQMSYYLKTNAIDKITEISSNEIDDSSVKFTINENGDIVNAHISKTSGNPKIDKLLINSINKMPKWKPAKNNKGVNVKQDFEFRVSNQGC